MNVMQFLLILKARKRLIILTLIISVAVVTLFSMLLPKAYTARASLVVNVQGGDPVTGEAMPNQLIPGYLATQVNIIGSHNVALKVVDDVKLAQQPGLQQQYNKEVGGKIPIRDWLADSLAGNLNVQPAQESNVIYVAYKSNNPQTAAKLANAFVSAYIQTNLDLKTQPARQTAAWYDAQLGELRKNLEKSQLKLSDYQQSKGIVSLDSKLDIESTKLAELSSQLVAAQGQTYDSLSVQRNASNASAGVMGNPVVQSLKTELARSETNLSKLAEREGKNYPEYQRAAAETNTLREKLAKEISTTQQSMSSNLAVSRQREGDLRAAVAAQKAKVLALNAERDAAGVMAREVDSAQKAYDQALQRFTQTRLEGHAGQTEVSVLSNAVAPLIPSTPDVRLNITLAVLVGILLGIGLALVMEMLDRRVRSEYDLVAFLGVPVLGVLVAQKSDTPWLAKRDWLGLAAPKPL